MAPGSSRRLRSASVQVEQVDSTPSSVPSNPHTPMSNPDTPISSAASTTIAKKVRGPTRGKGLQKMIKATGNKMVIEISKEKGRPLEKNQSAKLSNELGIISRNLIPVPTKWKELNDEDKQVAFERLNERFEINLDEHARQSCEDLLKGRSRNHRYKLRQRFLKHGSTEEARRDVPRGMSQENWNNLCNLFENPKHQRQCIINKENKSKQTIMHNRGSKAFVVIRHELRGQDVNGVEPNRIEFFKDTHYKEGKGWTSPDAELRYNEMKCIESDSTFEGVTSLSPDEIVDQVLGTRSGYIKGLGHGPKPITSTRTLKQKNSELEEALKESTRVQQELMERLATRESEAAIQREEATIQREEAMSQRSALESQRATIDAILARQAESDKLIQALIASRVTH